jgi:hypothetical protein
MKSVLPLLASFATALTLAPVTAAAQSLSLDIKDGLVTLDARDVSLRQILQRWAEIGGVILINGDKVAPTPVTLQLSNVTERAALDTLLRPVSGYILGGRAGGAGVGIDRIMILPTSSVLAGAVPRVAAAPLGRPARAAAAMAGESAESVPTDIEAARGAVAEPESGSRVGGIGGTVGGTLGGIVGGTAGSADGAAGPFGLGGASIAADGQAQPRTRTSSNPTRYSDETNGAGPRLRAPTVPTRAPTVPMSPPAEQPAAKAPAPTATPTNPFGNTAGTATPGVVVPAAPQPKP